MASRAFRPLRTSTPTSTWLEMLIGLVEALGESRALLVGHDIGAHLAWTTALIRPDRLTGVVSLSIPPRAPQSEPPVAAAARAMGNGFYQAYFQEPGVAEADLEHDVKGFLTSIYYTLSGESSRAGSTVGDQRKT